MRSYDIFCVVFLSVAIPVTGLNILLSAGSSYLVLGRMGWSQSRGWPLKYP